MTQLPFEEVKVDVLVLGTEAAGAKAAIEAHVRGASVLAVSKGIMGRSGTTVMAGWGLQAPLGHGDPRDNPDVFLSDVVKGGAYLNNQKLVERLVNMASVEALKIEKWGALFVKSKDGKFMQFQLPGSTYPRSMCAVGQHGGLQWRKAMKAEFKRQGIVPLEDFFVTRLLMSRGEVAGAVGISLADGRMKVLRGKVTVLATGGVGQLFKRTDMPSGATGDGLALALEAGAELQDMEFHQFFPYDTYGPPGWNHISCASLRYTLHGKLYNSRGEEFLERYIPEDKGWGLRDPTSRAIYLENKANRGSPSGGAFLSVTHLPMNIVEPAIWQMAPDMARKVKKLGIDLSKQAFEVGPAVHYTIGGIRINENCDTVLSRLIAAGENAAGMDGAERIDGGPAICWCLTMGQISGESAAARARELDWLPVDLDQVASEKNKIDALCSRREGIKGPEIKKKLKEIMWEKCGLVRNRTGMEEGLKEILAIRENDLPRLFVPGQSKAFNVGLVDALEVQNMVTLAEVSASSALMREESRRAHYRTDFPEVNNKDWVKNIIVRKSNGKNVFTTQKPIMHRMQPPQAGAVE